MNVTRLHLGDVRLPSTHPTHANVVLPLFAYMVDHNGGTLLFDTGLGPHNDIIDSMYELRRASLPVRRADLVVNCHLHFDHCGGNQFVVDATIIAQRVELELAREPMYTVPEWVDFPGARWQVIDGEHSITDDIRIVPTPGHTDGHQSVLLSGPDGLVVLAGQVAQTAAEFETSGEPSVTLLKSLSPGRVLFAHDAAEWQA